MSQEVEKSVGLLPQSTALLTVTPDTLSELLSRDPEGFTEQDDRRVIEALRAHRERLSKAASEGKSKTKVAIANPSEAFRIEDLGL